VSAKAIANSAVHAAAASTRALVEEWAASPERDSAEALAARCYYEAVKAGVAEAEKREAAEREGLAAGQSRPMTL
jgi:hypothetical protein